MIKRTATANWIGDLKLGKGSLDTQSGVLKETPYSFKIRFENEMGTNPEELLGVSLAGCFTMALSAILSKEGYTPAMLSTSATVTLDQIEGNWTITLIYLEVNGQVPDISKEKFEAAVKNAKENCLISRVLKVKITTSAYLE